MPIIENDVSLRIDLNSVHLQNTYDETEQICNCGKLFDFEYLGVFYFIFDMNLGLMYQGPGGSARGIKSHAFVPLIFGQDYW